MRERCERPRRGPRSDREADVEADRGQPRRQGRLLPSQRRRIQERRSELRVGHGERRSLRRERIPIAVQRQDAHRLRRQREGTIGMARRQRRLERRRQRPQPRESLQIEDSSTGSIGCHTAPEFRPDAPAATSARSTSRTLARSEASAAAAAAPTMPPPITTTSYERRAGAASRWRARWTSCRGRDPARDLRELVGEPVDLGARCCSGSGRCGGRRPARARAAR